MLASLLPLTSKVFPVTSNSGGTKAPSGSSGEGREDAVHMVTPQHTSGETGRQALPRWGATCTWGPARTTHQWGPAPGLPPPRPRQVAVETAPDHGARGGAAPSRAPLCSHRCRGLTAELLHEAHVSAGVEGQRVGRDAQGLEDGRVGDAAHCQAALQAHSPGLLLIQAAVPQGEDVGQGHVLLPRQPGLSPGRLWRGRGPGDETLQPPSHLDLTQLWSCTHLCAHNTLTQSCVCTHTHLLSPYTHTTLTY